MVMRFTKLFFAAAVLSAAFATAVCAQNLVNLNPGRSLPRTAVVQYLYPEQIHIKAGQSTPVALHFRVADGMHINSHTPSQYYLIPTTFTLPKDSKVRLESIHFPEGSNFTLPLDPKTRLSVYTGEFVVNTHFVSPAGDHLLEGKLHFQACNDTQCMPPETITVPIDVVAH